MICLGLLISLLFLKKLIVYAIPLYSYYIMLCYVTLRYVTLRYVTLRYVTLRYVTLRYVMLCCIILYNIMLYYIILYYIILCYYILYYITLYSYYYSKSILHYIRSFHCHDVKFYMRAFDIYVRLIILFKYFIWKPVLCKDIDIIYKKIFKKVLINIFLKNFSYLVFHMLSA